MRKNDWLTSELIHYSRFIFINVSRYIWIVLKYNMLRRANSLSDGSFWNFSKVLGTNIKIILANSKFMKNGKYFIVFNNLFITMIWKIIQRRIFFYKIAAKKNAVYERDIVIHEHLFCQDIISVKIPIGLSRPPWLSGAFGTQTPTLPSNLLLAVLNVLYLVFKIFRWHLPYLR